MCHTSLPPFPPKILGLEARSPNLKREALVIEVTEDVGSPHHGSAHTTVVLKN